MGVSSFILKLLAKKNHRNYLRAQKSAIKNQEKTFQLLLSLGNNSVFFKDRGLSKNLNYFDFSKKIGVSKYEDYKNYISRISFGEKNILTKGRPDYFAITSGTTSGTKYIPLTKKMWGFQSGATKELLLLFAYQKNDYNFSDAGMMFIQGSPKLGYLNKVPCGKLSGIAARHIPFFLKKNRYPSMKTNSISPWDKKIKEIVKETWNKDMQILGGIPPWVITYFEALLEYTGKSRVDEVFPNIKLYIHGGTKFDVYKSLFFEMCGDIDTLEVFPASEGFFAYQDRLFEKDLLLLTNHGVFYEFISLVDFNNGVMRRIPLEGVKTNINYVMVVSTVAGLWAYNTGDTVMFVSVDPYRIIFSGRASQYCSAFGEHVIEKEVQEALSKTLSVLGGEVVGFSVCPKIGKNNTSSRHDWFIEFSGLPDSLAIFEKKINDFMCSQNPYYKDLFDSGVIGLLKVFCVERGGFNDYMKSIGKFGGQNKCPHLSNDRKIGDFLLNGYVKK